MRDNRLRGKSLDSSVPTAVVKLFRQFNRVHNKALKVFELSTVQAHILVTLFLEGPSTSGTVQHLLAMGGSTLAGALDRMEKGGLVKRMPVPGDRRASKLSGTWSKASNERLLQVLADTEDECLDVLSSKEQEQLLRLLTKLSTGMRERYPM